MTAYNLPDAGSQLGSTYKANIDYACSVAAQFTPYESATPDMKVNIAAGNIWNGFVYTAKAAQASATITAPSTNPRIDRISVDQSGTLVITTGTEAASPVAPAYPKGNIPLGQISLATSTTAITNSLITPEIAIKDDSFHGCLVSKSSNQTLTTGTQTHLTWDTEAYDTDSIHDNATNTERLTVPTGATEIKLKCQVAFTGNTTGFREVHMSENDDTGDPSGFIGGAASILDAGSNLHHVNLSSAKINVSGGDYYTIAAQQNSGGNLDVIATSGFINCWFYMEIVG